MFLIQNRYVRCFNLRRRRDGPLFRGRYFAGLIESDAYWYAVIHYIDANPVEAGLADSAAQYPWCSTSYFLPRRASKWLVDDEVGTCVREIHESHLPRPNFGILEEMIESRLTARHDGPDPLDDLVRGAPRAAFEKMRRRAELADGSIVGIRLAHPETLLRFLRRRRRRRPLLVVEGARKGLDAWPILEVGILMEAAGLSGREAAALTDTPQSTVYRRSRLHEQALSKNVRYAAEAFWIVTKAVREDLGAQILESGGRHRRPRFKAD